MHQSYVVTFLVLHKDYVLPVSFELESISKELCYITRCVASPHHYEYHKPHYPTPSMYTFICWP